MELMPCSPDCRHQCCRHEEAVSRYLAYLSASMDGGQRQLCAAPRVSRADRLVEFAGTSPGVLVDFVRKPI